MAQQHHAIWTKTREKIIWYYLVDNDSHILCDVEVFLFLFLKFRQEYLDTLYRYAKFQYECGNYSGAAEYLYFFRVLVSFQLLLTHIQHSHS